MELTERLKETGTLFGGFIAGVAFGNLISQDYFINLAFGLLGAESCYLGAKMYEEYVTFKEYIEDLEENQSDY